MSKYLKKYNEHNDIYNDSNIELPNIILCKINDQNYEHIHYAFNYKLINNNNLTKATILNINNSNIDNLLMTNKNGFTKKENIDIFPYNYLNVSITSIKGNTVIWHNGIKNNKNIAFNCVNNASNYDYPQVNGSNTGIVRGWQFWQNDKILKYVFATIDADSPNNNRNFYVSENQSFGFWTYGDGYAITTAGASKQTAGSLRILSLAPGNRTKGIIQHIGVFNLTQMFGKGNEPSNVNEFKELFYLPYYDTSQEASVGWLSFRSTGIESYDKDNKLISKVEIDVCKLTGKLNGEGESVTIFPNGMNSTKVPYDYEVEYIEKTTSGCGTGFRPDYFIPNGTDIVIKTKLYITNWRAADANGVNWFAAYTGATLQTYGMARATTTAKTNLYMNDSYSPIQLTLPFNTLYEIEMSHGEAIINGTKYNLNTTVGGENTHPFVVFTGILGKLYYFQVYKGDKLVLDLIPVKIGEKGYMYDRIAHVVLDYYTPAGTEGSYTVGPTIVTTNYSPVCDEIVNENGTWVAYKRIDCFDVNSVNWTTEDSTNKIYSTSGVATKIKKLISPNLNFNWYCTIHRGENSISAMNDKSIMVGVDSGKIFVRDTYYTVTTIKNIHFTIFYELNNYERYVLNNQNLNLNFVIADGGTVKLLPEQQDIYDGFSAMTTTKPYNTVFCENNTSPLKATIKYGN